MEPEFTKTGNMDWTDKQLSINMFVLKHHFGLLYLKKFYMINKCSVKSSMQIFFFVDPDSFDIHKGIYRVK